MKKILTAFKSLVILGVFLLPFNAMAQENVGDLFKSSPQDATKLIDAYLTPLFKGTGLGLATGWNNTAKAKNFLRFELRITGTLAAVPTADKTYNTNNLNLSSIKPAAGSNGIGPTAFGDNTPGAKMEIYTSSGAATGQTFNLPESSGFKMSPAAQLQLTVGLPKNIDLSLRLIPSVTFGNNTISQFGLGTKIELLPLLMKKDKLIPFDLAVALGFTNTTYKLALDINNGAHQDQSVEVKFKGFNAEAIISKKILFFTPFASVGYNSSNSALNAYGTYDFQTAAGNATFTNPVAIKHDDISSMKASLGFQLNLAFLRVYASYTQSKYSYLNAGLGVGIGK